MVKKLIRLLSALLSILIVFCTASCAKQTGSYRGYYFNTSVTAFLGDKPLSNDAKTKLDDLFSSLQKEFDPNDQNSLIYQFNNADQGAVFNLSAQATAVFELAKECYTLTGGLFNPAIYPLVELWQFAPNYPVINFYPPTDSQIQAVLPLVDFDSVVLDSNAQTITKTKAGVKIDFGGILKGYASQLALDVLKEENHTSGYVSIGSSSLQLLNSNALDVRHPRSNTLPRVITVNTKTYNNLSVSSSGDYEKVYAVNGKTYSHIINPSTGKPTTTNVVSVTMLGVDGSVADALTTACCLLDHNPQDKNSSLLISFLKQLITLYPNCMVYAIYDDGESKQIITNKLKDVDFTLHDAEYTIVNF